MLDVCLTQTVANVSLWLIALDAAALATAPTRLEMLSEDERERAARFHAERDRRAFIVAHASMREILGSHAKQHPRSLCISAGRFGKPYLADTRFSWLQFNLSHSGELAVLAVVEGVPIGVDVECIDAALDFEPLAARVFPPAALADFEQAPRAEKRLRFFQWWARTEAVLKASGVGFAENAAPSELARFNWMDLELDPCCTAALAWPRELPTPRIQILRAPTTSLVAHMSH